MRQSESESTPQIDKTTLLQYVGSVTIDIIRSAAVEEFIPLKDSSPDHPSAHFYALPVVHIAEELQSKLIKVIEEGDLKKFNYEIPNTQAGNFLARELTRGTDEPFITYDVGNMTCSFRATRLPGVFLQQTTRSGQHTNTVIGEAGLPQPA